MESPEAATKQQETFFGKRRNLIVLIGGILVLLLACCIVTELFNGEETVLEEIMEEDAEEPEESLVPTETASPTQTPVLPTDTPEPVDTPTPRPTLSPAGQLEEALKDDLSGYTIRDVRFSDGDAVISTRLDRASLEAFFADIGAIHGIVVRENPDVDRVTLDDVTGQQIIMPMDAMRDHYNGLMTFEEFRDTWTVIDPD